ncbi:MAG: DEAD/DEAH box helicase family protein [[Clostridium] cocleatum]|jgi:N12 class adenine-specific DNA methylase|uniref:SNF2-related protein n=2 Tax=Thomasclavelia cocleata TaxID=69824 RepID=UPI002430C98E|nr:SNF2-related protein [Thomasclavelia cocleata]MCI9630124.1 DEAD/DEAH box helicase family protein [Thomasclavelia cocleata]
MAGRKRKKVSNYEQLSLFELLSAELDEDYTNNIEENELSVIRGTEKKEASEQISRGLGRRSDFQVRYDNKRNSSGVSSQSKSNHSRENQLYGKNNENIQGTDDGVDVSTTFVSVQENSFYNLDDDLESKLSINKKYEFNINAIELLNELKRLNKTVLSKGEKDILARYSGWGGCSQVFDENNLKWSEKREYLKELISIDDYNNARASTLTSFFTPYPIIDNIYKIIDRIGFKNGNIIETSCGVGNFFGRMPKEMLENSFITGIEIDNITGNLAKNIYNNIDIHVDGFENIHLPKNSYDLAISNVPFGTIKVFDKEYNKYNFNIHNYFFAKALDLIRNGGIIAFITSSETLDGNNTIREYINQRADFLGAIRLPSNIFMANGANTRATADIIFLQRNDNKDISKNDIFLETVKNPITPHRKINRYFIENPDMVFGIISERKNQYGTWEIIVNEDKTELLDLNIDIDSKNYNYEIYNYRFKKIIHHFGETYYENDNELKNEEPRIQIKELSKHRVNSFFIENEKIYYREINSIRDVNDITGKARDRLIGQINIAEITQEVIDAQINNIDDKLYLELRSKLNDIYDNFVLKYGYLFSSANSNVFKNDCRFALIRALEDPNPTEKTAKKEAIFFERTIKPYLEVKNVKTLEEAVNVSLNSKGKIDIEYISVIYRKNKEEVLNELINKKIAFIDPETDSIVSANEYLSGNIRKKMEIAIAYGKLENYSELEKVLPEKLDAEDIVCQLGATWIDDKYVKDFVKYLFKTDKYKYFDINYDSILGIWIVDKYATYNDSEIDNNWCVMKTDEKYIVGNDGKSYPVSQPSFNGWNLIENILNSKTPEIFDYWFEENPDDPTTPFRKRKINIVRTAEARNLSEEIQKEFSNWIFEDIERRQDLVDKYNKIFNSWRLPEFDGSYLTFPQMNKTIQLEQYQKNAIARIMTSGRNTLLSQRVGAGKTFEMIAAGMEMKRLGLKNKLLYVVPNHLVNQWGEDFMKLYPQANILVADKKDFVKNKRMLFINKIATCNFDAIIMAHSSFGLIPMNPDYQEQIMLDEIHQIQNAIDKINYDNEDYSGKGRVKQVKQLEKAKKSIENNIRTLTDIERDNGITFDELGIDFMFVDEAHEFKNLYIYSARSNIAGIPNAKSQKASDMLMKTKWLNSNNGNVCFATGTPISNTMAELYVLQKYLQDDVLCDMGITCFDAWAKNFGEVITSFEISIDGNSFKSRDRFCKFFNLQELMTVFKLIAEIQTESMLIKALKESTIGREYSIPPSHIGGKPTVITIEPSDDLKKYIDNVVERAEAVHNGQVDRHDDNMLKITTDSKKASIDLRLNDEKYEFIEDSKINIIAKKIINIYNEYDRDKATQLVFCDSSTPNKDKFNVYDELKRLIILYGIDEKEIAFIHDYETMKSKQLLFDKVNKGEVRVLFGSTAKLGAGTNVQKKLIAIHHVDVPWRASDVGRILRTFKIKKNVEVIDNGKIII